MLYSQHFHNGAIIVTIVHSSQNYLRLNVGFLINQPVGTSRDFLFDIPELHLSPDLNLGDITGTVRVTRTAQGLLVQVNLQATLQIECVRCLNEFPQPLTVDYIELYTFSQLAAPGTEFILPESGQINLGSLLREYMLLEVPINPLCSTDCRGFCPTCGENLNTTTCSHQDESIDPRFEILKTLLNDENSI